MSSQASPVVFRHRGRHGPATGIVVAGLVALLILFLWLHFVLAQEIESAGREILLQAEELHRVERHNHELRHRIAIAGSQERMAQRSREMGYAAQQPVYLLVEQPLPPTTQSSRLVRRELAGTVDTSAQAPIRQLRTDPVTGRGGGD